MEFQNRNRHSIRLDNYDYSSVGYYFITICCFERLPLFGIIQNHQMILNDYGLIAYHTWLDTANKRQNVNLHNFIIMPNHMHAIIEIREHINNTNKGQFVSQSNTLGAIVRGYKSSVSSQLKEYITHPIWQRNYYEHIIRNEQSYQIIFEYIQNNPALWEQDRFYC